MPTNTRESGFEEYFTEYLVNSNGFQQKSYSGNNRGDYSVSECADTVSLFEFLEKSQPLEVSKLRRNHGELYQAKFLKRLQDEIKNKGILIVLRKGIKDLDASFKLFYFEPVSDLNQDLARLWKLNSFVVARQLYYSSSNKNSLDMVILVNGLPIITLELKNLLTGQNHRDAIEQYKNNRSSREELFRFERCLVHFAMDTEQVFMTTHLSDTKTYFLPFNRGNNGGAGNPVSEDGIRVDYMWREILTKSSLSNLIQNFVQTIEENKNGKKSKKLIFPRYHQLQVVKKLLLDAKTKGVGQKYLIQHSAGSGKSNSIAWLAHQLTGLFGVDNRTNVFDSVLIVTDRNALDRQLRDNVMSFEHQRGLVETITDGSRQLRTALQDGKKIIITTIQKFPFVLEELEQLSGNRFAVIIDEAHSSTSGESIASLNKALIQSTEAKFENGSEKRSENGSETEVSDDFEQEADSEEIVLRVIESRKMLKNVSYFAFTATPKSKTLELFGARLSDGSFTPFDSYTMKQAIEEGFILDVLANYTTYKSYFGLNTTGQDEREYDTRQANKQLRRFVESHPHTIESKARIMLTHFYSSVYLKGLVGGRAKAMVVTSSRQNAVKYSFAFKFLIRELNYPLDVITAISGDVEIDGNSWNESSLNGFSSNQIPEKFENGEYQILICANKYQTGFDQPLLQTMYVDKKLGGVSAVQTLSRLNRFHKDKDSTFVLDFVNTEDDIKQAFEPYYTTTFLSGESDPNKLNDLKSILDDFGVYTDDQVSDYTKNIMSAISSVALSELHKSLDQSAQKLALLSMEDIDDFKKKAKSFVKFYSFIAQVITFDSVEMEELYQFLKQLNKKIAHLGSQEKLFGQDVLDSVDFESYRNSKNISNTRINLEPTDSLEPTNATASGANEQPKDVLENIITNFNKQFGTDFKDEDKIRQIIENLSNELIREGSVSQSYSSTDAQNRALVFKKSLDKAITEGVENHLSLYNGYYDNQNFQKYLIQTLDKTIKDKLRNQV